MTLTHTVLACALVAAAVTGCKKADTPPAPQTSTSTSTSGSVALPESSRPPSDASMSTAAPSNTPLDNGNANAPAQNSPKALTKEEESTAMPLSGQVNNHSTAKPEGDKGN
ncbi:MAG TPA: hypothetical protein VL528_08625 [Oxalicibacterium sp.]|nr:hypothetical protein [Oxalicibacterium sp.]